MKEPLSEKETIVLNAIKRVIGRRRSECKFPLCALRREIAIDIAQDSASLPEHELTHALAQLVKRRLILYRPAQNDQSYYLLFE